MLQLVAEQKTEQEVRAPVNQRPQGVESEETAGAHPEQTGQRGHDCANARQEFRRRHRLHAVPREKAFCPASARLLGQG